MIISANPTMAEFVSAIQEWDDRHGVWRHTAKEMPKKATNLGYTRSKDGQPAAIYSIPNEEEYALIVLDHFTGAPRILARIKREHADTSATVH